MNYILECLVKGTETFLIPLTSILLKVGKHLKYLQLWVYICSCMCTCICIFKYPLFQGHPQLKLKCRLDFLQQDTCYWGNSHGLKGVQDGDQKGGFHPSPAWCFVPAWMKRMRIDSLSSHSSLQSCLIYFFSYLRNGTKL